MYISSINSNQNISSKAQFQLIAEKNLLPKGAAKQLEQKAKTIGRADDTINVCLLKKRGFENNWETVIKTGYLGFVQSYFTNYETITIEGSFKERQKKTFAFLNDYLDSLKEKFEK